MIKKIKVKRLFMNPDNLNAEIKKTNPSAPKVTRMIFKPDEGWTIEFDSDTIPNEVRKQVETLLKSGLTEIVEEES